MVREIQQAPKSGDAQRQPGPYGPALTALLLAQDLNPWTRTGEGKDHAYGRCCNDVAVPVPAAEGGA